MVYNNDFFATKFLLKSFDLLPCPRGGLLFNKYVVYLHGIICSTFFPIPSFKLKGGKEEGKVVSTLV